MSEMSREGFIRLIDVLEDCGYVKSAQLLRGYEAALRSRDEWEERAEVAERELLRQALSGSGILSRAEFEQALHELRTSQSEVVKEEQVRKLRIHDAAQRRELRHD